MHEGPTEEQRAAYEALSAAIDDYHAAYDDPGLVMDWVVVSVLNDPREDGSDSIRTSMNSSNMQPAYRTLGLLQYASEVIREQVRGQL